MRRGISSDMASYFQTFEFFSLAAGSSSDERVQEGESDEAIILDALPARPAHLLSGLLYGFGTTPNYMDKADSRTYEDPTLPTFRICNPTQRLTNRHVFERRG